MMPDVGDRVIIISQDPVDVVLVGLSGTVISREGLYYRVDLGSGPFPGHHGGGGIINRDTGKRTGFEFRAREIELDLALVIE